VCEVVVDAPAERVELRELEHGTGVCGDERVDALDVEESLERLRHVERARLQLRHEPLLEREHHDHLERVAVPFVNVFVLQPQQIRDLRLEVAGLLADCGARVFLVEALESVFIVGDRAGVFVEQKCESLVGALVSAELLGDEVEQVEVLGHVDQLVLHAVDYALV